MLYYDTYVMNEMHWAGLGLEIGLSHVENESGIVRKSTIFLERS